MELFHELINYLAFAFNIVGAAIIVLGGCGAVYNYLKNALFGKIDIVKTNEVIRFKFGSSLVFGLEFFIASDIVKTIAVPTWTTLGILGATVAIRTVLSFFLSREIEADKPSVEWISNNGSKSVS